MPSGGLSQRQQATASTGFDVVGVGAAGHGQGQDLAIPLGQKQSQSGGNQIDRDALTEEQQAALDADDFIIYGKASIEQYDIEDQRITMDALVDALDRFFDSEDAPGIISRGHTDVPVGRPIREHTLDEDTTLVVDGERYEFAAGETLRTEVKDADDDGLPELWLVSRLANDSELSRETRLRALAGDLNGFSVTVYPLDDQQTQAGEDVLAVDLHAVTIGTDEQIKNKGSEFDVAEFKLGYADLDSIAQQLSTALGSITMDNEERSLFGRILKKSGEELEDDAQSDGTDTADAAGGDAGDESLASPLFAAVEDDTLSAEQANTLDDAVGQKMDPAVVKPLIDAISEGDLDVEDAVDMIGAMKDAAGGSEGGSGDGPPAKAAGGDHGDEDEDEDDEEMKGDPDADGGDATDDAEQKGNAREVAEAIASRFDIPVDEVMEHLENLEMESEKDDAGELKSAAADGDTDAEGGVDTEAVAEAAAKAAEEAASDAAEQAVEQKLSDMGLADGDVPTMDDLDERLEEKLDNYRIELNDEVKEVIQKADTTTTPSPTAADGDGAKTIGDTLPSFGGDS